ncbi:hypothetical protein G6F57_008212 [Rhizopus arrhizus]|nr:hypothetical protein G6F23_007495 [Rhizopus arrhizus]KAG1414953.1 hypothetical protein G6F58_006710 [Rhizopus delemar]KAG0765608.1 hypothetical protein G6F24_004290 [Rhizopus arrhizus]KAG0793872.1 hypothetical protein G6F21_003299 [Rhizopus arrhizus]KAG0799176.1 hypothetical protein G6F22_003489 [Rhizopus arrhizus]
MVSLTKSGQIKQSISDFTAKTKSTKGDVPPALVGASTTVIGDHLYVFGGRVASTRQMTNHLYILHLPTLVWIRHIAPPDSACPPSPRYFHSATAYKNQFIVVFGGMSNVFPNSRRKQSQTEDTLYAMDDISMFDIETMSWVEFQISPSIFTPQARYAHLATIWNDDKLIVMGGQDVTNQHVQEMNIFDLTQSAWIHGSPIQGTFDAYRAVAFAPGTISSYYGKMSSPFWKPSKDEQPPVCVYANYNFNDLTRDLQSFWPLQSSHHVELHPHAMAGSFLPPGLRFPTGQLIGQYLIVSGTLLNPTQRGYHIWALNLTNLSWTHINTGQIMSEGSWNRGLLSGRKYYVLGHHQRDLKEDYSFRRLNFDHIGIVDLEAFGIFELPKATCSLAAQELGLAMMHERSLSDVTIWTADRQSIIANSTILAKRWSNFAKLLRQENDEGKRILYFPETYPVALAFLQYLYTDHLLTAQQHQPQVLARLLILADIHNLERLRELATFAMHQLLTISTASMVYETAMLTSQSALQIRALRILLNTKRMLLQYKDSQHLPPPPLPSTPLEDWNQAPVLPSYVSPPHSANASHYSFNNDSHLPSPPLSSYSFSGSLRRLAGQSPEPRNIYSSPSKSTPTSSIAKKKLVDHNFSFNVL